MKIFMSLVCLCLTTALYGQRLQGIVLNQEGKQTPIDYVGIFNKNTGQHSHSNSDGSFILPKTTVGDSIYFSRLGYTTVVTVISQKDVTTPITIYMEASSISLDQIELTSEIDILSRITDIDVQNNPVKSSQEILTKVPGLIIGQHAGGGKAEQIFLRGFDVDHGTDVAISVDGMPVNMPSHAHGQGYADLHFVIPETIKNVGFGKGPYYADKGNFNTAGFVNLKLLDAVENTYIAAEAGQFDTSRFVGLFPVLNTQKSTAYIGSELYLTDGPVESPQNFNRINLIGKYQYTDFGNQIVELTASHFQSKWDASGQIPIRAVEQGLISRFGAIDDTEGGNTSRTNLALNHTKFMTDNSMLKTNAYVSQYDFELYSNFTFFLEDPENGDQIRQKEDRILFGANTTYEQKNISLSETIEFEYQAGIGFRYDDVNDVELSETLNRQITLNRISFGDVDEVNTYGFLNTEFEMGKWKFNPSLRLDYFKFDYENKLSEQYDRQSQSKVAVSPKFNVVYSANQDVQLFFKSGIGFHSNDARVVIANQGEDILPAAYGVDLGTIIKPFDRFVVNAAVWSLFLDQEFVYVGDAGIVEPSGKSRRLGVELGARYQVTDWLYTYSDINYTYARSTDEPDGADLIPLAPDLTAVGGITVDNVGPFSGSLSYRFIDDRAANEDNSIVADGYFVTDVNLNYTRKNWTYSLIVENLFDTQWNETQFATESRLFNESAPVEEIHFTPGTPFYLRGKIAVTF
ncbi:TonB-dependent receptor plug domain-containing protein [uncultured Dokdonia sp.]|uniref:TonB-dependent receptor n=1 Tax=uncultured Dokdonia sp. TaxID=575653 RepID=UPI002614FE09|nr:TonB-dependent receptor plug domain-containing protein [uncultured Dokdonia sp.]